MKISCGLALLAASLLQVPTRAQEPKTSVREYVALAGTVETINRPSRLLSIKDANGVMHSTSVAPDVALFDELKTGDRVVARLRESIVVSARPGLRPKNVTDTTAEAARAPRAETDPQVTQQLTAVVTIESIDRATNAVVYKTADNRRIVRAVGDPRLLDGIKPGDVIEVTLTRERVIELHRQ